MQFNIFADIEKLEGVDIADSNLNNSPLLDPNVTLLLKNGYKVISAKSLVGQSIELLNSEVTYIAYVYHALNIDGSATLQPDNAFYKLENGTKTDISFLEFQQVLGDVVGEQVMGFLSQRHESIPFLITVAPEAPKGPRLP